MASWLIYSIQSLSLKLLDATRGSQEDSHQTEPIEEELKRLSRLLQRIEAVKHDAADREIHDRSVELWLRELRGVSHEAEDVLDEYHYEVLRSIVVNRDSKGETEEIHQSSSAAPFSSSKSKIFIPDGTTDKIKQIRKKFEEISEDKQRLQLREEDGERRRTSPLKRPPTGSHIDEKGLFGRENEKKEIINLLNPENISDFIVVPIVGKGGLGKTTLAQLVYNDSKFCRLFDKMAWVSVSENFDLVRLTRATIESISESPCMFSELSKLQEILKEKLAGIKLFLVLDDVWNENNNLWQCFCVTFTVAKTVRILTTTRNYSVARIMQTISPFPLAHLPEEKCWRLFKSCVFDNQEANVYPNLLEIGRDIVKKCNGLPLAVKVLGGLLRYETDEEKWKEILESETWTIDEKEEIMSVLSFSYHYMPLHMRSCFLYLSMFPKGTNLDKNMVVRLWMAQGYINPSPNKTLEDIGTECFEELQCRSLIDSINDDNYVLHDLIHDLARSINERMYPTFNNDKPKDISFLVYHLCLNGQNKLPSYVTTNNNRCVRTLFHYQLDYVQLDPSIISMMACLRVLELRTASTKLPVDVGILKHLRYLKIDGHQLERLPESICALYNLQTLDLRECGSLRELPRDIGNLINLLYLMLESRKIEQIPESICYLCNLQILKLTSCQNLKELPGGIKQLTSLRVLELSYFGIDMPSRFGMLTNLEMVKGTLKARGHAMCGGLGELNSLINLGGSMFISGLRNITGVEFTMKANLKSMSNLKCLELNFDEYFRTSMYEPGLHFMINNPVSTEYFRNFKEIERSILDSLQPHGNIKKLSISGYGDIKFPSWISDPLTVPNLTYLDLLDCCTRECCFLPTLGRLPSLKFLLIFGGNIKRIGNEFCRDGSSNIAFPALQELTFWNMTKWEEWIGVLDGDFPSLKKLSMKNCSNLRNISIIPTEIEELKITNCGFHEIQLTLLFKMKNMQISHCEELTSIIGLHAHKSLTHVSLSSCPLLEISVNGFLQSMTISVKIWNCLTFDAAMLNNIYFYLRDAKLQELKLYPYHGEIFPESSFTLVCIKEVPWSPLLKGMSSQQLVVLHVPALEQLEICDFEKGKPFLQTRSPYLTKNNFNNLKRLFISGCSKLRQWKDKCVPALLEYLEVAHCNELTTIPGLDKNSALLEIRIRNCRKLNAICHLHCLTSLKILFFKVCQELQVLPSEKLQFSLQSVEVCDCPRMRSWCKLNNFFYFETEIHYLNDEEGSSMVVGSVKADNKRDPNTILDSS